MLDYDAPDLDAPDHDSLDEDFSPNGKAPSSGEEHPKGRAAKPMKISRWATWPLSASLFVLAAAMVAVLARLLFGFFWTPQAFKDYDASWSATGLGLLPMMAGAYLFVNEWKKKYIAKRAGKQNDGGSKPTSKSPKIEAESLSA